MREFTEVYEQHVSKVYGFFGYMLRTRADAEDLTQQTFERALKAWHGYDQSRGESSKWLMVIARSVLKDHLRSRRARQAAPLEEFGLEQTAAMPDRRNLGPDPDLERALGELSLRDREVIALRFGGDLTASEIASVRGLSTANVQQIMSRSLRKLRAELDGARAAERRVGVG